MAEARRHRAIVIIVLIAVSVPLMGCLGAWLANEDAENDAAAEALEESERAAKEADSPTIYYDTEEGETKKAAEGAESVLFDNQNILAVQNGGTSPKFEVPSTTTLTKIRTYHWNDANGNGSTGKISLRADSGKVYGPWETVGAEGQGGVPNAYWAASPNVTLPAGRYTVLDSDPGTWSQNADSGGEGFVIVYGQATQ